MHKIDGRNAVIRIFYGNWKIPHGKTIIIIIILLIQCDCYKIQYNIDQNNSKVGWKKNLIFMYFYNVYSIKLYRYLYK